MQKLEAFFEKGKSSRNERLRAVKEFETMQSPVKRTVMKPEQRALKKW